MDVFLIWNEVGNSKDLLDVYATFDAAVEFCKNTTQFSANRFGGKIAPVRKDGTKITGYRWNSKVVYVEIKTVKEPVAKPEDTKDKENNAV